MSKLLASNSFKNIVYSHLRYQGARAISTSVVRFAEPPKKKRRLDPTVLKLRTERKIKKTEREIWRLESEPKQPIPIQEYQLTNSEIRDLQARPKHSMEEFGVTPSMIRGARRLWAIYRAEQARTASKSITRLENAQESALQALKMIDKDLYDRTLEIDETVLIPYRTTHMRRETAPNPNYTPPDGNIKDVTKDYVM